MWFSQSLLFTFFLLCLCVCVSVCNFAVRCGLPSGGCLTTGKFQQQQNGGCQTIWCAFVFYITMCVCVGVFKWWWFCRGDWNQFFIMYYIIALTGVGGGVEGSITGCEGQFFGWCLCCVFFFQFVEVCGSVAYIGWR